MLIIDIDGGAYELRISRLPLGTMYAVDQEHQVIHLSRRIPPTGRRAWLGRAWVDIRTYRHRQKTTHWIIESQTWRAEYANWCTPGRAKALQRLAA